MRKAVFCIFLTFAAAGASFAGLPDGDLYLVSVGRGVGAAGSIWYTTVWLHNPEPTTVTVTVSMLYRGQQNSAPEQQTVTVRPGETLTLPDALLDLFGATSASGALRFQAPTRIFVSARIFNQTGSDAAESQGQFMAGLPAGVAIGPAAFTDIAGITQPADESFRCNFALVETAGANASVTVTLYDGAAVELASRTYNLRPYEPIQQNLSNLGSGVSIDGGRLHLEVTAGGGRVLGLASMVGNGTVSQDPSTLEMEIETTAASGDGDITAVHAGEGLIGGGSSGEVTLAIDTTGAAAGETLLYDGSGLEWVSPPGGLTLPYRGESLTTGAAFKISNTSTSGNVFGIRADIASTAGSAIFGWSASSTGLTSGVLGQAHSSTGVGVAGYASSPSGETFGVYGVASSPDGRGIWALAASESGEPIALLAEVASENGRAVVARNSSGTSASLASKFRGLTTSGGSTGIDVFASRVGGHFQVDGDTGDYGVQSTIYSPDGIGVYAYTNSATGYAFYASGAGADYGPFTGAHEVKLAPDMPPSIRPGLIVSAVGDTEQRRDVSGEVSLSSTLPTVALSQMPRDRAVFGVVLAQRPLPDDHWYTPSDGERFAVVNALGEGRVWVTDVNGEIRIGDYITTSSVPGYGQRQDDDLLHSYTLGKAIEAVEWQSVSQTVGHDGETFRAYLIAVVYTSG